MDAAICTFRLIVVFNKRLFKLVGAENQPKSDGRSRRHTSALRETLNKPTCAHTSLVTFIGAFFKAIKMPFFPKGKCIFCFAKLVFRKMFVKIN